MVCDGLISPSASSIVGDGVTFLIIVAKIWDDSVGAFDGSFVVDTKIDESVLSVLISVSSNDVVNISIISRSLALSSSLGVSEIVGDLLGTLVTIKGAVVSCDGSMVIAAGATVSIVGDIVVVVGSNVLMLGDGVFMVGAEETIVGGLEGVGDGDNVGISEGVAVGVVVVVKPSMEVDGGAVLFVWDKSSHPSPSH